MILGQLYDKDGNITAENCEDDVCQSIIFSAIASSQYTSNRETQLHFESAAMTELEDNDEYDDERINDKHSDKRTTIQVPAACYTCERTSGYWSRGIEGITEENDKCVLDEVTEVLAIVKRRCAVSSYGH